VVLFAPATLGGKVLSASDQPLFAPPFPAQPPDARPENPLQFDAAFVFEPDGLSVREALREGRLPVWAPELAAGWPLLATQQSAPLFPLTWIGVVFPYFESLVWVAVIKLALAALGMFLLARALGLRRGPALLGAVAFGFGTYLIVWLMHPHANAYVFLPWLFLLGERLCRSGSMRDGALLGGTLGVAYLGGQPESSLIVWLATAAWVAYRLAALRPPRGEAIRRVALAVGASVLGAALAAVMVVPLVEALRESYNTSRSQPPLPARSVLTVFFPEYWGRPDRTELPLLGPSNFTERTLYAGVLPTLLAAAGLVARRPSGVQLFFAGLAAAALLVALDTGPQAEAAGDLPVLDQIQLHRVLVLASFGIAMLAAFGYQRFLEGTQGERQRMLVAGGVAGLLPGLAVLAAHPSWLGDLPDVARRFAGGDAPLDADVIALQSVMRWLVLAAIAVALLAALARRRHSAALVAGAVLVAAADLLVMGWGYNPAIDPAEAEPPAPPAVEAMRQITAGGGRAVGVAGLVPNTASRWGLHDARGHEQPLVERTNLLWIAMGGVLGDGATAVDPDSPRTPVLLDVFGVRAALHDRVTRPALTRSQAGEQRIAYAGPGGVVVERRTALPPAFVAYAWRPSANLEESLVHMGLSTTDQARDQPVIEGAGPAPAGRPPAATPAKVVSRSDTEVVLEVRARTAGHLVLLDTFYPGWRAEVDGRDADIRPANAAFRAIEVRPGRHEVRFSYRPASVIAGGAISIAALAALALFLLVGWRARRGSRTQR
jgi:Bacterial membrane protein YfhO